MPTQYAITNKCSPNLGITVGSDNTLTLEPKSIGGSAWGGHQRWVIEFNSTRSGPGGDGGSGGQYTLTNVATGLSLECPAAGSTQLSVADFVEGDVNFSWDVAQSGPTTNEYVVACKGSGGWLRVDLRSDVCAAGTVVQSYGTNGTSAQRWNLQPIAATVRTIYVRVVNDQGTKSIEYSLDDSTWSADPDDLVVDGMSEIRFTKGAGGVGNWDFGSVAIAPATVDDEVGLPDFTIQSSPDQIVVTDQYLHPGSYTYCVTVLMRNGDTVIGDPKIVNREEPGMN